VGAHDLVLVEARVDVQRRLVVQAGPVTQVDAEAISMAGHALYEDFTAVSHGEGQGGGVRNW